MSPAHATTAAVVVVAGATVDRPLHNHRRLQLLQTLGSWSGSHPLPSIDRLIGQWSPRIMTLHHEVVMAARVPPMVGACALTRLHRWSGLHHGNSRGRRRKKKNHGGSRRGRPSAHEADPKDHLHREPPRCPPPRYPPSPCHQRWHHHQAKPGHRDLVRHRI
jgi:hypothetical protein